MAEYVDREALLNELEKINPVDYGRIGDYEVHRGCRQCLRDCKSTVNTLQPADVAPVVHGSWVKNNDSFQTDDYYCCYFDYSCSECGEIVNDRYKLPKYCPNCGARMDLEAL